MSDGDWGGQMRGGLVWSVFTYGASRAITLITTVLLARLLVPSQFGLVAAVLVFLSLIELASDLGMNATVIYEQQQGTSERVDVAFTINLILSAVLVAAGLLLAPLIAGLFDEGAHVGLFRLATVSLLFTALGNIHDSLLMREMAFRRRTIPQLVRALVRGGVSITLALAGLGATSLVVGMLCGAAAWSAAQWILTAYRPKLRLDRAVVRSMAAYGGAASIFEIVALVATRIDQIVIARVLGAASLGLYTIAFRVPEVAIDSVSWTVSIVAFPALARQRAIDRGGLGAATLGLMRYQALYALPVAAALSVLATPLVVVLFGTKWEPAGAVMSAIAVMSGITAVIFPLGDVFKAIGRQRTLVLMTLVQVPLFVAVMVSLASYGIVAVAWARVGAIIVHSVMMTWFVVRAVDISLRDAAAALRPALAAALGVGLGAAAVRLAWPALSIGPLAAGACAAACGGALTLRLLSPGTLSELRGIALARRKAPPAAVGA